MATPQNIWVPLSIFGGAVVMAFSLGVFYWQLKSDLNDLKGSMWTRNQMRQFSYDLSVNPGLKPPDVDAIAARIK